MSTQRTNCEGCPDPASNKLPIREHDLHMPGGSILIAFLCPDCVALDDGNNSDEKYRLRKRVQLRRRQESQGQQERAE